MTWMTDPHADQILRGLYPDQYAGWSKVWLRYGFGRIWGIAAYAFRFVFSQNIGSAVEGWYSETGHWEWIFWQNAALTPVMILLTAVAMPHRPVDRDLLRRTDWAGILYAGIGFGLIYAGLDQGNRLDWLNSGVVTGLLLSGGMLVVAFIMH